MRRAAAAAAAAAIAATLAPGPPARAGAGPAALDGWLDADAPIVATLEPAGLEAMAAAVARTPGGARAVAAARVALGAVAGFDPLSKSGWSAAGFDADAPIAASLGAIDPDGAQAVYAALVAARRWDDRTLRRVRKVFWRSRAVLRVTDWQRARKTVDRVVAAVPGVYAVGAADAPQIAALVGERPRHADRVVSRLGRRGVVALGWIAGLDAYVAVRALPKPGLVVVDVVGTFAGVPIVWPRDSRKLLAAIERAPGTSLLAAARERGAGATRGAVTVWLRPRPLMALLKAVGRHAALRAAAFAPGDRRALRRAADAELARCAELDAVVDTSPLADVAFAIDVTGDGVDARTVWGLRDGMALAAALLVDDDELFAWTDAPDRAVTAAVYLGGIGALRGVPRPPLLRDGLGGVQRAAVACGGAGAIVAGLFGWPQLAGAALDALRAGAPDWAAIVEGARNAAVVVRRGRRGAAAYAAAITVDDADAAAVRARLARAAGRARDVSAGGRPVRLWSLGPRVAFAYETGADAAAFGVAADEPAARALVRAAGPTESPPLARARIRVRALAEDWLPGPVARVLARYIDRIDWQLAVAGDRLEARTSLRWR